MCNTHDNGSRIGFLLTEEETEKVTEVMNHLGMSPRQFIDHCISVMWGALMHNER